MLTYQYRWKVQPLNDYEDLFFFRWHFLPYFCVEWGVHIPVKGPRKTPISLAAWAK